MGYGAAHFLCSSGKALIPQKGDAEDNKLCTELSTASVDRPLYRRDSRGLGPFMKTLPVISTPGNAR
jgi:hypothetical protein